jgi:hypothetical protein
MLPSQSVIASLLFFPILLSWEASCRCSWTRSPKAQFNPQSRRQCPTRAASNGATLRRLESLSEPKMERSRFQNYTIASRCNTLYIY